MKEIKCAHTDLIYAYDTCHCLSCSKDVDCIISDLKRKLLNEITENHDLKTEKAALEQWQKDAVPHLKNYREGERAHHSFFDKLEALIKQAEGNGD
jgi:hypothetical protein